MSNDSLRSNESTIRKEGELLSMLIIIIAGIIILAIVLYVSGSRKREEAVWGDDFTAHMAAKRATEAAANKPMALSADDLAERDALRQKAESGSKADTLRYAIWLDDHGQYAEALEWYKKTIGSEFNFEVVSTRREDYEGGVAHYRVGLMYRQGHGVPKDDKAANRHFTFADRLGNEDGTLAVIEAFRYGIGVEQSAANRGTADYYERKLMEKRQRGG